MAGYPAKLHLGCGLTTPTGWLNVDGSWNVRLAKRPWLRRLLTAARVVPRSLAQIPFDAHIFVHDLEKPLPFETGTFDAVYSSHTLEHLHLEDARRLLHECARVLKPGGVCRTLVPDLRPIVLEYAGQYTFDPQRDPHAYMLDRARPKADVVNLRLLAHFQERTKGSFALRAYRAIKDFHTHKWMYDGESLAHYMREAGLVDVAERGLHDSRIAGIEAVERPERVLHGAGVVVEGVKPG